MQRLAGLPLRIVHFQPSSPGWHFAQARGADRHGIAAHIKPSSAGRRHRSGPTPRRRRLAGGRPRRRSDALQQSSENQINTVNVKNLGGVSYSSRLSAPASGRPPIVPSTGIISHRPVASSTPFDAHRQGSDLRPRVAREQGYNGAATREQGRGAPQSKVVVVLRLRLIA